MSVPYHPISLVIRATCQVLGIPQPVLTTALQFCHRIHSSSSSASVLPLRRVVQACVFLACKVEEHPIKTSDLINTVHLLLSSNTSPACPPVKDVFPELAHLLSPTETDVFVGSRYYERKDELLADERTVLLLLEYQVLTDQPHKYLFNFGRVFRASKACLQLACCVLNDLLIYTDTCAQYAAPQLAAASLSFAIDTLAAQARSLNPPLDLPASTSTSSSAEPCWFSKLLSGTCTHEEAWAALHLETDLCRGVFERIRDLTNLMAPTMEAPNNADPAAAEAPRE